MEEREICASNMGDEDEDRTILVSGVPTDFRLEAIQSYFESKNRSNGGPIKGNPQRIQDSGKVIITFESERDAENVVQKKIHNVSKYDLRVNRYKNLVWQEDAMIVSNAHRDIPVKMLIDFLEKKGKLDIVYVSPGRKPGTFLVYCQNEIDLEYVQKMCQKKPLEGNQLKVDAVEEINSVLVKTVSSNVSSDRLKSYLGDRKRSSGGDISSIQQQTKDTYIVSFKEKSVVLDVCSRQHLLDDMELDVQPSWEPFEENTVSRQQVQHYLLPSKFHLSFLKKHKLVVNDQLKNWAKVMWKDSKFDRLKLNYTEGNAVEIEQRLNDLLKSITVEIIAVPTNIFKDIVRIFSNPADQRYFYFDDRNFQANILGFNKSNVIKMKKRLLDNFKTTCGANLNIHERYILSGLRFFEQAERQFKDLKIRCHGNKIFFEGYSSEVANCQENMYKILQSIVNSKLYLPLNAGMIINKKPVKECLHAKLRNKNCIGSWETSDDSVLLYASDKKNLLLLEEIMKQTFVANKLDFIHKIKGTSNYGKWLTFVKSLKEKFSDFYFIGDDSLSFVAVDVVVNDIKSKIDNFEQSLIYESQISMTPAHFLFLKQFNDQEINDFCQKNKIKNVCLKENKIHMEGTENQTRKMEIFTENLRKDISSKEVKFEMFGFQEFLDSEEGVSFLSEMQMKSECIISLNSDLGCETEEIFNFVYKNCEIVLREGDITTLDTDAIVNAANGRLEHMGGIAAAIVQKGGFQIQAESNRIMKQRRYELKTGEVVSTNAGKLKCKTIIHAVGPVWNNGRSHEMFYLSRAVQNCLAFLDEKSYTSIAIPAISTGIFGIPIEEGTKCTLTTIKNYLDRQSNSKIKHICLIDIRKDVIRAFKLHLEAMFGVSKRKETTSLNASLLGPQQKLSSMTPITNVASGEHPGIKINLMLGSISSASVDVIVNSTNKELKLDSGAISKFILNAAGPQIQAECNQKYPDGISTSTIAVTKGYNLKCKNVFHLVLPHWDEGSPDSILANLTQIITICLRTAEKMGAKNIAFPILGAGTLKYPIEILPRTLCEAVRKYSLVNSSQIKGVYFAILPRDTEIIKKFDEYLLNKPKNKGLHSKETTPSHPSLPGSLQKSSPLTPGTNVASGEHCGIKIHLMIDSISSASVDVIVNSTNEHLQLDSGAISKFILNTAGPQIQDECNQKYPDGISTSTIAVTKGYNLKCKNVFHLVLPHWDESSPDSILANLTQIITICLQTAEKMGAKSLAFPILGAGTLKYPIEKLPRTMYEAVKNYSLVNSSRIKDVNFVVYPADTHIGKKFKEYFQEISTNSSAVSSEDEDDKNEEIHENVSADQQDVGVILKFIAKYKDLDNGIRIVEDEYHSLLTTEEIPFDVDLIEDRKLRLMNIRREHKIQISVSDSIKIYGRLSDVKDAKLAIRSLLMEFKETDMESSYKEIVQWYYFDENYPEHLTRFGNKENVKLEKAFLQKKKSFTWKNVKCNIQQMSCQIGGRKYKMKRKQNQKDELIPDTWSPMEDDELFKIVPVTHGPEYDDIQIIFRQNLPSSRIIKIERIQNKTLYHGYQALKKKYEAENPGITNEVQDLWHGTAAESVDGINKSGFNRSYCGKNATAFGEGVYFAKDIKYSANDTYSTPDSGGIKKIYKCSVLVGRVMRGSHGLKYLQDSNNSAVNDIHNPSIYVIFHDSQAYPNYLITFSNRSI